MNFLLGAINPIAYSLGPIDVRWYGVIIASGIVLAFIVAQREMVKRSFHPDFLTDLLMWAVPLAILGARFYYVLFKWEYYAENPGQILQIWEGGLAIHGALEVFDRGYTNMLNHGNSEENWSKGVFIRQLYSWESKSSLTGVK